MLKKKSPGQLRIQKSALINRANILLSVSSAFVGIELVGLMSGMTFMSSIQQLASTGPYFNIFNKPKGKNGLWKIIKMFRFTSDKYRTFHNLSFCGTLHANWYPLVRPLSAALAIFSAGNRNLDLHFSIRQNVNFIKKLKKTSLYFYTYCFIFRLKVIF